MKKWILILMATLSIVSGLIIEPFTSYVDIHNLVDFSMDSSFNFYFLNYMDNRYYLAKANSKGRTKFYKELEQPADEDQVRNYKQIQVSPSGEIFLLYDQRKVSWESGTLEDGGIICEKIVEYNSSGEYVKEITGVDFSKDSNLPKKEYIYKFQILGDETATIICHNENTYNILTTDVTENNKPTSQKIVAINEGTGKDTEIDWLNDMIVAPNGQIVYSTKQGKLYVMNSQNESIDITSTFAASSVCAFNFSVDSKNNVYFMESSMGRYYKLNLSSMSLTELYRDNSVINNKKKIKLDDVSYIYMLEDGQYYAVLKYNTGNGFISFGSDDVLIKNLKQVWSFYIIAKIILISFAIFAIAFLVYFLLIKLKNKFSLRLKIVLCFLPFYVISMLGLLLLITNQFSTTRKSYLNSEQKIALKVVLDSIDKQLFETVDPVSGYMSSDYQELTNQLSEGFKNAEEKVKYQGKFINTYKQRNDKLYRFIGNEYIQIYKEKKSITNITVEDINAPIDHMVNDELADLVYSVWNKFLSYENLDNDLYEISDEYGQWIASFEPIRDDYGNLIGMVQGNIDRIEYKKDVYSKSLWISIAVFLGIFIMIVVVFVLILKFVFKPLKSVTNSINDLSKGKWDTRLVVKSNDEFSDIARAFNLMLDRLNLYISNLVLLNKEYIKFVPLQLINLIGKSKITDIHLNDMNSMNLSLMKVVLNRRFLRNDNNLSMKQWFQMTNSQYDVLFKIVENNHGVIQTFDDSSMVILFPNSADDAIVASVQFEEFFAKEKTKDHIRMILNNCNTTVGIIGNEKRTSITVIPEEEAQMDYINKNLDKISAKHIALEPIISKIKSNSKYANYGYRFIGQIKRILGGEPIKVYEFIDMTSVSDKNLYLSTKSLFEEAVKTYIRGDFSKARNLFANVLRINEEDKIAMNYLVLCDKNIDKKDDNWKGYMFD